MSPEQHLCSVGPVQRRQILHRTRTSLPHTSVWPQPFPAVRALLGLGFSMQIFADIQGSSVGLTPFIGLPHGRGWGALGPL